MKTKSGIETAGFTQTHEGKDVSLWALENDKGTEVAITNYGARVVSLMVETKTGSFLDVVLGFDSLDDYLQSKEAYFGATIGRYANRIAEGRFSLGDEDFSLAQNNGTNNLHGGIKGFHDVVWEVVDCSSNHITMSYRSADGEEGFPGNLKTILTYTLTEDNQLQIDYSATTDKQTLVNLTHHSFFNLKGAGTGTVLSHLLKIHAQKYTPVSEKLIPTGTLKDVTKTPFDFTDFHTIGERIESTDTQLNYGNGYDHNFVLSPTKNNLAASVFEPSTGIMMEVYTDQPGMQCYTGNFLDGSVVGKKQLPYKCREAFCLETQKFPDSPNQSNFPTTTLTPHEKYSHRCVYKFSISLN